MSYALIKNIHLAFAMLTTIGFCVRGVWMMTESSMLQKKLVKVLPHIVDTTLLISAVTLVVMSGQYPWVAAWVGMKIALLVAYVVLGTFALKRGKNKQIRTVFFAVSILILLALFAVAGIKPGF
ncbi:MAG TPA: invasion protein [Gammaproteobacteria bacterium]|nr:invasion protein [Gammaproteobacteria bacterium]|tara:strand:- start:688 stop:1059 length:372 start_codon:yes stop_codon:yes gene_type:complete